MAPTTPRENFGGSKTTTFTGTGANGATLSGGPVKAMVTEVVKDTGHDQKSAPGNNHTRRKVDIQGNAIQSSIVGGHVNNIGTLTFKGKIAIPEKKANSAVTPIQRDAGDAMCGITVAQDVIKSMVCESLTTYGISFGDD